VFIDTPPHAEEALKATSALTDFILIPTRPAILDLRAIADTVGLVQASPLPSS
jgi:chromosome partitioning protein